MHAAIILRLIGQLLMLFSITLLPPVIIDIFYREDAGQAFFYSYLTLLTTGFLLWLPVRNRKAELRLRDGFVVVAVSYTHLRAHETF